MAEEEEDGIATQEAKDLTKIKSRVETEILEIVLEGVIESQREFEEIEQKTAAPHMDIFPRYGGWVNGSIFEVVDGRKRDYKEMIKRLKKIISEQEKSSTVCKENEEPNQRERGIVREAMEVKTGKQDCREATGESLSVRGNDENNGQENERPDQVKEEFLENLHQVLVVIRKIKENLLKYLCQLVKMIVNMVRKIKAEEAAEEEEEKKKIRFLPEMLTSVVDFTKLDKASRKVGMIKFPEAKGDAKKSKDEDLDKEWKKLEETEDRAVNLGIDLSCCLIEFSLLGVHWTQTLKQLQLKNWILLQSFTKFKP